MYEKCKMLEISRLNVKVTVTIVIDLATKTGINIAQRCLLMNELAR
jgi:hypothetical protein